MRIINVLTLTAMLLGGCAYYFDDAGNLIDNRGFDPDGYRRLIALGGPIYSSSGVVIGSSGGVAGFHKRHPQAVYDLALTTGVGALTDYWSLDITAVDIATYIVVHERLVPWNVALTAGDYLESWIGIAKLANDRLAASEILSDGVKWGETGIPPVDLRK